MYFNYLKLEFKSFIKLRSELTAWNLLHNKISAIIKYSGNRFLFHWLNRRSIMKYEQPELTIYEKRKFRRIISLFQVIFNLKLSKKSFKFDPNAINLFECTTGTITHTWRITPQIDWLLRGSNHQQKQFLKLIWA